MRGTGVWRPVSVLIVAVLVGVALQIPGRGAAAPAGVDPPRIHLQSRQFVPPTGIEPALQNRLAAKDRDRLHVLIQLPDIPAEAKRHRLAAAGVQLLDYIPEQAWFASVPADPAALQQLLADVRWLGLIQADDKLAPGIRESGVGPWARHADGSVDVTVSFFADVPASDMLAAAARFGATVLEQDLPFARLTLRLPEGQLRSLAQEDGVRWIVEAPPPKVPYNDDVRRSVQADAVHAAGITGSGVKVGIWDSGSVGAHTDLAGRVTPMDTAASSDHSTHVAGTIAGNGALSGGKYEGMAPDALVYSWDWNDNVVEHQEAVSAGVVESSNSWGYGVSAPGCTPYGSYQWDAPQYDQITRGLYGAPIVVFFAAGNNQGDTRCSSFGNGYDTIGIPATAKDIITVGAVNSNDSSMTSWSSWGPTDDGRVKPDVVAPGCQTTDDTGVTSTLPNDRYGTYCGTSMATPATAGTAALTVQQYRQTYGRDPLPATTKAALIHTATDLGSAGPDFRYGYGIINARAATQLVAAASGITEGSVADGQMLTFPVSISGPAVLKATLVWSDKEAAENAAKTLVNDLDLTIVGPAGTFYPWKLNPSQPSAPATTGVDSTNNVEQVVVEGTFYADWAVRITGTQVPYGPQSFSLIVTVQAASATPTPSSTATATAEPTATPTPSATSTPTSTPSPSATPTATPTAPPASTPVPSVHVGDLAGQSVKLQRSNWKARVTITVHDATHSAVAGAKVDGHWSTGAPVSCTTDDGGTCTVQSGLLARGQNRVSYTVDGVSASAPYAPGDNHDPDGDSSGTTISVSK